MKKQYIKPIIKVDELFKFDVLLSSGPTEPSILNPDATSASEDPINGGGSHHINLP